MQSIFKDLLVIDLSTVLAGPSVAMFFAECGAEVIKIENPKTGGDVTRSWKLATENPSEKTSAYFSSINYGKKYEWLDIASAKDYGQLIDLVQKADILISNFKNGDDIKFKLTSEHLFEINPRLIIGQIKGYRSNEDRIAYDVVLQAECGFMYMNGTPDNGPTKMPVAMIDVLAAHQLKEGLLCALLQRKETGKGSLVSCALEETGIASLFNQSANYLMTGNIPQPMGSLHPNIAPYGEIITCNDGVKLVLAIGSDRQYQELCEIIGRPELGSDIRFVHNIYRVQNRKELLNELQLSVSKIDGQQLLATFIDKNIPAGEVKTMDQVFRSQTAKDMILEEKIDGTLTKRSSTIAFRIEGNKQ